METMLINFNRLLILNLLTNDMSSSYEKGYYRCVAHLQDFVFNFVRYLFEQILILTDNPGLRILSILPLIYLLYLLEQKACRSIFRKHD